MLLVWSLFTTTSFTTVSSQRVVQPCVDKLNPSTGVSDCPARKRAGYCNSTVYNDVMTEQCPFTCGRCNSSSTVTTNTACVDKVDPGTGVSECPARKYLCSNTVYFALMTEQCPFTCGRCSSSITSTAVNTSTPCVDKLNPSTGVSDCPARERAGYCNSTVYYDVMTEQCPLTCGRCNSSSTVTTDTACSDRINPSSGTSDCPSVAYLCNNSIYYTLMTEQCSATCGRCTSTTNTANTATCLDKVNPITGTSDCPSLLYLCDNALYRSLMTDQCPATCGRCNAQADLDTSTVSTGTNPTTTSFTTTGVDPTAVLATIPFCDPNWILYETTGFCYYEGNDKNYDDAELDCVQKGGHLASIHITTENDFVNGLTRTGMAIGDPSDLTGLTWIGLRRVGGDFVWTDGTPVDFVTWQATQPDNAGAGEDCVQTYSDFINGTPDEPYYYRWNDYPCDKVMRAYVCKKLPSEYVQLANGNIAIG